MTIPTTGTIRSARVRLQVDPLEVDLLGVFGCSVIDSTPERFYWAQPADGVSILALGEARSIEATGHDRFESCAAAARELFGRIEIAGDEADDDCGPLIVGGFSFADRASFRAPWEAFPSIRFVLPRWLVVNRPSGCWLIATGSELSRECVAEWAAAVCSPSGRSPSGRSPSVCSPSGRSPSGRSPSVCSPSGRSPSGRSPSGRSPSRAEPDPRRSGFELRGVEGMARGPEYRVRSDRSHADYRAQVDAARDAISEGELEKVVLARSLRVRHDGRTEVPGLLSRLQCLYPSCVTFAVARAGSCFLGATPERLVALDGDRVWTSAVAGSAPRGHSPEEDERAGRGLRESKKEQAEHAVVVRSIAAALGPICEGLSVPESPRLLRLDGIQHLETPIEGRLRAGERASLLQIAGRLHPTPAVGGEPRSAALDWIECYEGLDRGWYAGGVGWLDRKGGGELRVALRSGLLRSDESEAEDAFLFAGGGIVADSQPERELEETRIKLRALLAPLTEI